jgi:hypothetical protein
MTGHRLVRSWLARLGASVPFHHSLAKPASARMTDAEPYPKCCSMLAGTLSKPHMGYLQKRIGSTCQMLLIQFRYVLDE